MIDRRSISKRAVYMILTLMVILSQLQVNNGMAEASPGIAIELKDVPIGSIVVDTSWTWEYRKENGYRGNGETKSVEWIVVAKDHYLDSTTGIVEGDHVTLLSNELVAKYLFTSHPSNDWGNSTKIRPFLNTDFFSSFSNSFKNSILETTLNMKTYNGGTYTSKDKVFLPSENELGGDYITSDGIDWGYFSSDSSRIAVSTDVNPSYLTRTPSSYSVNEIRGIGHNGKFNFHYGRNNSDNGIRPALNLKSDTMVKLVGDNKYGLENNRMSGDDPEIQLIKEDGELFIKGSITLVDDQEVTITSTIGGVKKSTKVKGPIMNGPWRIVWLGTELEEGVYYPPDVHATGTGGFNYEIRQSIPNSGTKRMTVDKTPPKLKLELTSSR